MSKSCRTNNLSIALGWNNSVNKLVRTSNPNFWIVLQSINMDERGNRFYKVQKSNAGDH